MDKEERDNLTISAEVDVIIEDPESVSLWRQIVPEGEKFGFEPPEGVDPKQAGGLPSGFVDEPDVYEEVHLGMTTYQKKRIPEVQRELRRRMKEGGRVWPGEVSE